MGAKKKQLGQYFTPELIARFMVSLIDKDNKCAILEPSAGKGIFLDLLKTHGFHTLTAYEIDETLKPHSSRSELITYQNFLATQPQQNYDVIIGNPPYVRWKNIDEKTRDFLQNDYLWKDKMNSLSDLLYPFMYHCLHSLKPGGELIFITPLFWMETQYSEDIRQIMLEMGELELLVTLHEMSIFQGVSSNIVIFKFIKEKTGRNMKTVHVWSKKTITNTHIKDIRSLLSRLNTENEISEGEYEAYTHPQFTSSKPWRPLSPSIEPLINSIEHACIHPNPHVEIVYEDGKKQALPLTTLFNKYELKHMGLHVKDCPRVKFLSRPYYLLPRDQTPPRKGARENHNDLPQTRRYVRLGDIVEIGNGMVSGLDEAFKVKDGEKFTPDEEKHMIEVLKARNLSQYFNTSLTQYIYFPLGKFTENEIKAKFPNIFEKLVPFKDRLLSRYNFMKKDIAWFEWIYPRNKQLMEEHSEKIFVPSKDRVDKRQHVRFVYKEGLYYATQDVTVMAKHPFFKESLKYILALLNSELIFTWIKSKGLKRGGVFEFSERPLSMIPIRLINWDDPEEVDVHGKLVQLVNILMSTKQNSKIKIEMEKYIDFLYGINGNESN